MCVVVYLFFFFNDTATTEIYTLSLHDALPICPAAVCSPARLDGSRKPLRTARGDAQTPRQAVPGSAPSARYGQDRKSTRLNSSHANISYAVFCLKKKKKTKTEERLIDTEPT